MSTAREIERLVKDAAKRKKDEEAKKAADEKSKSREEAVSQRKQLEEEMTKSRLDYARIVKLSIVIGLIIIMWIVIATSISFLTVQKKDVWVKPPFTAEDSAKASAFVSEVIAKASKDGKIEAYFAGEVPSHWKTSAKKFFSDKSIAEYSPVNVRPDKGKLGEEALFDVECTNPAGNTITFTIIMKNRNCTIMKINGSVQSPENKNEDESKNEKE